LFPLTPPLASSLDANWKNNYTDKDAGHDQKSKRPFSTFDIASSYIRRSIALQASEKERTPINDSSGATFADRGTITASACSGSCCLAVKRRMKSTS
jgi:adenine specific DNA methylase Mod